jgi:hypothetical protein
MGRDRPRSGQGGAGQRTRNLRAQNPTQPHPPSPRPANNLRASRTSLPPMLREPPARRPDRTPRQRLRPISHLQHLQRPVHQTAPPAARLAGPLHAPMFHEFAGKAQPVLHRHTLHRKAVDQVLCGRHAGIEIRHLPRRRNDSEQCGTRLRRRAGAAGLLPPVRGPHGLTPARPRSPQGFSKPPAALRRVRFPAHRSTTRH